MTEDASPPVATAPQAPAPTPRGFGDKLGWAFEIFGSLVVFIVLEHTWSLLAAIVGSIVVGALAVVRQVAREKKASPFTVFIAASVVVFGALDLRYQTGFFVKLEPALGNAVTGIFFLGSVAWGRPVIVEFAERGLGRKLDHARRYLTGWTVAWGLFFFVRASMHVWLAYHVSLDTALVVRSIVGPLSFVAMFGAEMLLRVLLYGKKALRTRPRAESKGPEAR
jgi:intracellular septation protein A